MSWTQQRKKNPELYRFVYASSSCNPILTFGDKQILSREGFQQGDPLSFSGFCDAVHSTLTSLGSTLRLGFMDDFSLSGEVRTVADDVEMVIQAAEKTGLTLNESKCEIIASNFDIENIDTFRDVRRVAPQHMTLLGAPVLKDPAVDCALQHKVDDLRRAVGRFALLHSHDALVLLRNSLAMPKLLYTLRTSPYADNKLLTVFD